MTGQGPGVSRVRGCNQEQRPEIRVWTDHPPGEGSGSGITGEGWITTVGERVVVTRKPSPCSRSSFRVLSCCISFLCVSPSSTRVVCSCALVPEPRKGTHGGGGRPGWGWVGLLRSALPALRRLSPFPPSAHKPWPAEPLLTAALAGSDLLLQGTKNHKLHRGWKEFPPPPTARSPGGTQGTLFPTPGPAPRTGWGILTHPLPCLKIPGTPSPHTKGPRHHRSAHTVCPQLVLVNPLHPLLLGGCREKLLKAQWGTREPSPHPGVQGPPSWHPHKGHVNIQYICYAHTLMGDNTWGCAHIEAHLCAHVACTQPGVTHAVFTLAHAYTQPRSWTSVEELYVLPSDRTSH
jgi:hypothetical protein